MDRFSTSESAQFNLISLVEKKKKGMIFAD